MVERANAVRVQDFSLFGRVSALVEASDVPVQRLGEADPDPQAIGGIQRFTAGVRGMLHWCRVNEQMVIERHGAEARVYAGFERLSRVRPVAARYRRIADAVPRLVLFGQVDCDPGVPATVVDAGHGPMAREWFLAIDAPRYSALLVARDQDGFGPTGPLQNRRFLGLAMHDAKAVREVADALDGLTG